MKMRKIAAMGLSAVMAASMVPALPVMADDAAGKVYYLNFKPEQDEAWQNLAAKRRWFSFKKPDNFFPKGRS